MEQENKTLEQIDLLLLLEDFLREGRRIWALALVLVALCCAGLGGYRFLSYTPRYQASASFTVKVGNPLYSSVNSYNTQTASQMAKTFPYILTSGVLQQRVKNHLDISYMPGVSAEVLANSNIFTLRVTDSDPQRAYDVLQAVMKYYPEIADFVVGPTVLYLLDESGVPGAPINSFSLKNSIVQGVLIGLALWCGIVLVLALAKSTIHSEDELRQALNFTCLGQIPAIKGRRGECPLYHTARTHQGFSEAVRLLHLRVEKQMQQQGSKVLLISSAVPGEGKTTVAVNMAVAMARKGNRVLLVDCDLRNPSVAKALKMKNEKGMAEYLEGKLAVRDMVKNTSVENLQVIVGGNTARGNQAEMLAQKQTQSLIGAARQLYDYVILDTPPCSLLADAAELAELAECAVMVVRQDYASRSQIMDGAQTLSEGRLPILGCVLNGMQRSVGSGYGYGYGFGYGYGYGYGQAYGENRNTTKKQ